ncbi:hypothetical protein Dsui_2829 [Azospira oryzae PS]|uniref:Uncharacterized protein n=1 Tax=Azospira oryzae (strain ATCC BAA-33 / DSM 13638 / PS) TaxID=640081 RepID=G8QFQ5_AZOOP|nr:hypothetical protein [Azospira oryzae]AEV27168.1 hypothetical protein Dsui_2829 [Azospira oryzae PS]
MTYDDFVDCLGRARLSIRGFSRLVCTHANTFTNYAKDGHVPDHWAIVVTLIAEMARREVDFKGPLSQLELTPKKERGGAAKGKFGGTKQPDMFIDKKARSATTKDVLP